MKYDVEKLEADLLALVKAKLPAKITEINTDKADSITLLVPTDAQYFNTTDDEASASNQILTVLYGLTGGSPISIQSATAEENQYIFLIYFNNLNLAAGIVRRSLLRYTRAFKEVFEENFDRLSFVSNMNIITIAPQLWRENEKSPVYKVAGVYIETSLAS